MKYKIEKQKKKIKKKFGERRQKKERGRKG